MSDTPTTSDSAKPNRRTKTTWKVRFTKWGLLLFSLTLTLLALEVATRYLTDIVPPLTVKDPVIGKRYLKSFEGLVFNPESHRKVLMRFNRYGFRGPDHKQEKPAGVRRVAILGDSMVAALSVDEEQTMVRRVEAMLRESNPEVQWEVMNFGVAGSSPGQEIVLYRELVSKFQPDIVLCGYFVGNDLSDNCNRLSMNPRIYFDLDENGELYQLPFSSNRALASQFLNRYSRFYIWQKTLSLKVRNNARALVREVAPGQLIYCRQESEDLAHAWKLSAATVEALDKAVRADGAQFAVVMIPSCEQVYDDFFQEVADISVELGPHFDQHYPDERMGAICAEAGISFFTMVDDFRQAAPSASYKVKDEWVFHNGIGHFNEKGNEIAATAVHRFLTQGVPEVATLPLVGNVH